MKREEEGFLQNCNTSDDNQGFPFLRHKWAMDANEMHSLYKLLVWLKQIISCINRFILSLINIAG